MNEDNCSLKLIREELQAGLQEINKTAEKLCQLEEEGLEEMKSCLYNIESSINSAQYEILDIKSLMKGAVHTAYGFILAGIVYGVGCGIYRAVCFLLS